MNKYLVLGVSIAFTLLLLLTYNEGKKSGLNKAENQCKAEVIIQTKEVIKFKDNVIKTKVFQQDLSNQPTDLDYRIKWLRLIEANGN